MTTTPTPTRRRGGPAANADIRSWRSVLAAVLVLGVTAVVFGFVGYTMGRPAQPRADSIEGIAAALAEDQAAEHRRLTDELASAAEEVHHDLMPLLAEMDEALPVDGSVEGQPATPERVDSWIATTTSLTERMGEFGMGPTSYNGALGPLWGSVLQIDMAVRTYKEALSAPGDSRQHLADLAAEQRDNAVGLWGVGAEQLDEIYIEAGLGHMHLFLPASGNPAEVPMEFQEPDGAH